MRACGLPASNIQGSSAEEESGGRPDTPAGRAFGNRSWTGDGVWGGMPTDDMNKARLLIVEDEAIVVEDLKIRLAQLGYKVAGSTASGEDAVAMAEQIRPDLVLMDIHLKGSMDGITATHEIRDRLSVPVVFLTAFGEGITFQRAKEAGPAGFILKPFEDRELKIVIEMALYKHYAENELKLKYAEIARFNQVAVGRELRMIELKQEINALLAASGKAAKYKIVDEK